ncbi:hypothetical protein NP493_376g03003 [Ridgeia piscesae]|uniref:Arylesterase n=1 Tax=Ridgeia piscesae TaxID=27915 RepID=A0AAD9NV63_RIDPI|nr:hypothetical protein NP493_376g03003 [Ridgeia piscesae]
MAPGNIFLFDFKKQRHGTHALDIVGNLDRDTFSPHGLSIWEDTRHITEENTFYFTNTYEFNFTLEVHLRLRLGSVGFYDGCRGRIVLRGRLVPNGINMSPDGKFIYLADLVDRFSVYARMSDNSLRLRQAVPVCSLVDNIDVDMETGDVWVTGHGDMHKLMKYVRPPHTSMSPSQVFRLTTCDGGSRVTDVEEVYYNDGRQFSGSSVAVRYRRLMLVGSVFTKLLLCHV